MVRTRTRDVLTTSVNKSRRKKTRTFSLKEFHDTIQSAPEIPDEIEENTLFHLLPSELLVMITSYLSSSELLSLSLVNKSMNSTITPIMNKILCDGALSNTIYIPRTTEYKPAIDRIRQFYPDYEPTDEYFSDNDDDGCFCLTQEDMEIIWELQRYEPSDTDECDLFDFRGSCDYCGADGPCGCMSENDY